MFKISNFLVENNLIKDIKGYKSKLAYSFMIGLFIGSLPFIYRVTENFRVQKLIQEQKKIQIQNMEKKCKADNSEYKKFLSLGFPKTATEKFKDCMNE